MEAELKDELEVSNFDWWLSEYEDSDYPLALDDVVVLMVEGGYRGTKYAGRIFITQDLVETVTERQLESIALETLKGIVRDAVPPDSGATALAAPGTK